MTATVGPVADAERWLVGLPVEGASVLCVLGLGDGHLLDVLDRRTWSGHVVALEPAASSASTATTRPAIQAWLDAGRLTIVSGPGYDGLDRPLLSRELTTEEPVVVVNPTVARAHREAVKTAARTLGRAWFGARANQTAKRENGGRYLLNTLRNARAISAEGDVAALIGRGAHVPGLLVGAGPSLDRHLADIVRFRDRALVIAADTALRPLLSAGVQPDLVVSVDPTETNARHLTDLPPCADTCLVAEGSLDPEALHRFVGRTFFFNVSDHHPWPWLRSHGVHRGRLRAWGSVLTTAFDLALSLGCDPIIFDGADLAFTDGRPYARGTTFEEIWYRRLVWGQSLDDCWSEIVAAWPEVFETGVDGAAVRTAPHLRSFRDWIATEAGRAAGRTIVNATGAGILAGPGIAQQPVAAVLSSRPSVHSSVRARLANAHAGGALTALLDDWPAVPIDVQNAWAEATGERPDAITRTLAARDESPAAFDRRRIPAVPPASLPTAEETTAVPLHPDLSDADAAYLAAVAKEESIRILALTDPAQNLLDDLRRSSRDLRARQALVIVDEWRLPVGGQVRRAVDGLLCERSDLWLEDRRFIDRASRLAVIRVDTPTRTRPPAEADRAKWDPAHKTVADELAPLVVSHLGPTSVVDVGCGAGYWLRALQARGVSTVVGITPRVDGDPVVSSIVRSPLTSPPALEQRFDVCLCLEVIQHLSPEMHDAVITECARLADVVVFSSRVPGTPGAGPHDRPMPHWAAKFWRHGYVGDDLLRRAMEHRWGPPRSIFEAPIVFRRWFASPQTEDPVLSAFVLAAARQAYEAWVQSVWWSSLAGDRAVPPTPRSPLTTWTIPPARLADAARSMRVFRFRTDAARWYLAHAGATIQVLEDGRPLPRVESAESLTSAVAGGWTRYRDEVTVASSDGSDPRTNGHVYGLVVPVHVAAAESRPLDTNPVIDTTW